MQTIWIGTKVQFGATGARVNANGERNIALARLDTNMELPMRVVGRQLVMYTFFLYKHRVYKHAEPQILENFKHISKHAPGSDLE